MSLEQAAFAPLATDTPAPDFGSFLRLTQRERSILRLAATGSTNVQIAASLHISKYTVAQHVANMLHRTGAANRTDLVHRAHVAGILSDGP